MVTKVRGSVFDEPVIPTPPTFISGSGSSSGATLAAGDTTTRTVTVTGAVLGDFALASLSVSTGALQVSASVTATDTVTVVLTNPTAGNIVLGVGTVYVSVQKK